MKKTLAALMLATLAGAAGAQQSLKPEEMMTNILISVAWPEALQRKRLKNKTVPCRATRNCQCKTIVIR
jgi:hypothetical protein